MPLTHDMGLIGMHLVMFFRAPRKIGPVAFNGEVVGGHLEKLALLPSVRKSLEL
jgi:hypothetical protein